MIARIFSLLNGLIEIPDCGSSLASATRAIIVIGSIASFAKFASNVRVDVDACSVMCECMMTMILFMIGLKVWPHATTETERETTRDPKTLSSAERLSSSFQFTCEAAA